MSRVFQALERVESEREPRAAEILHAPDVRDRHDRRAPADLGEYERLAGTILHARAVAPFKTMMLVAPDHGEGTSTVAAGLARVLAGHVRTLLVDANLRNPALSAPRPREVAAGLSEVLAGHCAAESVIEETDVACLRFVRAGAGTDESVRLLVSPRLSAVMREFSDATDIVILDAPPVLPYADALTMASKVDRVVLVTCADRTQRGHLERAKDELEKSGATILGVVLNRKASHAPPWIQPYLNA
jgi:capsular exopolysaccharide synthesis family protein